MKSYKFKDLKVGQNFITEFKGKHCELIKIESSYDTCKKFAPDEEGDCREKYERQTYAFLEEIFG